MDIQTGIERLQKAEKHVEEMRVASSLGQAGYQQALRDLSSLQLEFFKDNNLLIGDWWLHEGWPYSCEDGEAYALERYQVDPYSSLALFLPLNHYLYIRIDDKTIIKNYHCPRTDKQGYQIVMENATPQELLAFCNRYHINAKPTEGYRENVANRIREATDNLERLKEFQAIFCRNF